MTELRSFGLTDAGSVRGNNEDEVYLDDGRGIYFVIDGMGGHAAGEKAAQIAKERLRGRLERPTGTAEERLREAITLANEAIYEAAQAQPEWRGMACVLTVLLIENGVATAGHVGDSRLYRVTRTNIEKVTKDHSPVGELEDAGQLTEQQAMAHPRRNEVFRDVGSEHRDSHQSGFIDIYRFPFQPAEALLLCSDGLSDALTSGEMLRIIREHAGNRNAIVRGLLEEAIEKGKDNVSAIFVEGRQFGERPKRPSTRRKTAGRPAAERVADRVPEIVIVEKEPVPSARWKTFALPLLWVLLGVGLTVAAAMGIAHFRPAQQKGPKVLDVPGRFATIGEAVAAAEPGDTVQLAPGRYAESLQLKNGVTLRGKGAVLQPPAGDPAVGILLDHSKDVVIEDLKLEGREGASWSTGISAIGGDTRLLRLDVSGSAGAGIEALSDGRIDVEKSEIHDNGGAGISIRDAASARILDNQILRNGNHPGAASPGIDVHTRKPCLILGNRIVSNGAEAIWLPGAPTKELLQRNILGNNPGKSPAKEVAVREGGSVP